MDAEASALAAPLGSGVVAENKQVNLAIELIELGARLQVLQTETGISRRRLINLYKEVRGVSPSRGLLPFSESWFVSWSPNIHASLFYNMYAAFMTRTGVSRVGALVSAYKLYLEHLPRLEQTHPVLSLTRAWTLVRFFECGLLELSTCRSCHGRFVNYAHNTTGRYVCGLCKPPSRAGKKVKGAPPRNPVMQ